MIPSERVNYPVMGRQVTDAAPVGHDWHGVGPLEDASAEFDLLDRAGTGPAGTRRLDTL